MGQNDEKTNKISKTISVIGFILIVAILLCFIFVLFDIASFVASVKNTVETSCATIESLYIDSTTNKVTISVEELIAAKDYISKSEEYFSLVSNNSIISIVYAFSTTVILSIGALVLNQIAKKSENIEEKNKSINSDLNELSLQCSDLKDKITSISSNIEEKSKRINELNNELAELKGNYFKLLDLQNIISYMLYADVLIQNCKTNLDNKKDNFILLNGVSNKLKMIPTDYIDLSISAIKKGISKNENFDKTLLYGFLELRNQYDGLIKHYLDHQSDNGNDEQKCNYKNINYESIKDIIKDIDNKLNDGFFDLYI